MSFLEIPFDPLDKMILEGTFDDLMEKVGGQ